MEALPDPEAQLAYTNDTVTDFTLGSSEFSQLAFSWTQEVPYPGKRRLAGDVARGEVEVGERTLEAVRLRVRADAKSLYSELFRIDRTRSILEESRALLESFLETARRRYETGEGILENVLKAQTQLLRLDADLATIAQERRSVGAALNALLGREEDTPLGPALEAPRPETVQTEALEKAALDASPEVLALRAATRREESRLELAERNLKPDFMWGASYMNRGGLDPMVMGMFGMRLPLYKRRKQAEAVMQTRYEVEATERDARSREVKVLSEVRGLLSRVERAGLRMRLYREGILPQAQSALDSAAAAYAAGKTEFITLLDDFLSLLQFEKEYETERAEEATALAALEPLTGRTLLVPAGAAPLGDASHD